MTLMITIRSITDITISTPGILTRITWDDVRGLGNPEIKIYAKSSTHKDALQEDVIQGVQEAIQEDAGDGIVITIEVDR